MTKNDAISKVLDIAIAEDGYIEKNKGQDLDQKSVGGNGNYTKYWRDIYPSYQQQPWCLCFCLWCFYKAFGLETAKKMLFMKNITFYTPTAADYFKANKSWSTTPQKGDLLFFKNSSRIYHVAIVRDVSNGYVYTIEGNTSSQNGVDAEGGGVFKKAYSLSYSRIAGYGRPNWSLVDTTIYNSEDFKTYPISTGVNGLAVIANGGLNVRDYPVSGNIVGTLSNRSAVKPDKKAFFDGKAWYHIPSGWISASYLEGWIKEENNKWWYLHYGYTYKTNTSEKIDGNTYYFDSEGYMRCNELIKKDSRYWYIKENGLCAKSEWIEKDSTWYYAKADGWLAQNEFLVIHSDKYNNELYRFNDDCTLFTGSVTLKTNSRGALV